MVQMSVEQQECYRSALGSDQREERQLLPDITAKSLAVTQLLKDVENRQQRSYETSNEDDDGHSSLGDLDITAGGEKNDVWNDDTEQMDDPVGDMITDRLNEGTIPNFGYQNYVKQRMQCKHFIEDPSFDWTHILSMRNFRAIRKALLGAWATDRDRMDNDSSMKFLREIFLLQLITTYAIGDIALRTTAWLMMMAFIFIVHILIDVKELHQGFVQLLGSNRIRTITNFMSRSRVFWRQITETIHTDYLWGDHFQGRTIVWSEKERLPKFRRKHIALIRINKERKQNAKTTRRLDRDIKRSKRKGLLEDAAEAVIVNEAKLLLQTRKVELDATAKELNQKPPTYLPTNLNVYENEDGACSNNPALSDATNGHIEAVRFCHKMVFLREQEVQEANQPTDIPNDVSITHTTSDSVDHIEVVSKDACVMPYNVAEYNGDNSTTCSDFPSIGEHWNETDEDTVSYADSVSTSEQALPWLAVGAKIGEKLLNSRKLQRVVANPDQIQKTLPGEAMKLIDGMEISEEANEIAAELLMKKSKSAKRKQKEEKEKHLKQDLALLKRPVHGMWSSPGVTPPTKARPLMQTPSRFAVIEMPKSFDDPTFSKSSSPSRLQNDLLGQPSVDRQQKELSRLALIEKGVRIIVPLFSPDPNISISTKSSSFYQMVRCNMHLL